MSGKSIISNSYLEDIGDAIRYKKGTEETFYPSQMGDAIRSIEGIVPTGTMEIDANGVYDVTDKAEAVVSVEPDLRPLSVSENGTYEPDDFDGYSDVTVDVEPALESLSVTENGLYLPTAGVDGYDRVTVNVPPTVPDLVPLDVTANGQYLPTGHDGFSEVNVNVPTGVGGGLTLIDTIDVDGGYFKEITINPDWFDGFDGLIFVPYLTFSAREWLYVNPTNTASSIAYWPGANEVVYGTEGYAQSVFVIKRGSGYEMNWFIDTTSRFKQSAFEFESSFFVRLYSTASTMTGTIKIYGIKVT